jgi:hypothetical protein
MALNAAVVWEVRTTGSDTNGGGFKAGASGTDRSQQDAAYATLTTASTVHTTTTQINVAVGDFTVSAADVGNVLQVTGGTATAGFYEITAIDVGNNRWTVDRAVGTAGQTVAGAMGGALASLGILGGVVVTSHTIYIKTGTYSITSASTNVAGGCFAPSGVATLWIEGYSVTRGDRITPPTLQASGIATATMISMWSSGDWRIINLKGDGASLTSIRFINGNRGLIYKCIGINCTNGAFVQASNAPIVVGCTATGCSTVAPIQGYFCIGCEGYANTVTAFSIPGAGMALDCIASANTGASSVGFLLAQGAVATNCSAYANGSHGFSSASNAVECYNDIAEGNGGYGFNLTGNGPTLLKCAAYNNTSGASNLTGTKPLNIDPITGTATFFVDAATGDFALNETAGGGALVRAAGYPGTFPRGITTGYLDIGAAQHQDGGGGSGSIFGAVVTGGG